MDAEIRNELRKIANSLSNIEERLSEIEDGEANTREVRSKFPPLPFPAFDQGPTSLPI